jgi:hypothetical protein
MSSRPGGYFEPLVPRIQALLVSIDEMDTKTIGKIQSGAGTVQSQTTGTQEGFSRCPTPGQAAGGPGIPQRTCISGCGTNDRNTDKGEVGASSPPRTTKSPVFMRSFSLFPLTRRSLKKPFANYLPTSRVTQYQSYCRFTLIVLIGYHESLSSEPWVCWQRHRPHCRPLISYSGLANG